MYARTTVICKAFSYLCMFICFSRQRLAAPNSGMLVYCLTVLKPRHKIQTEKASCNYYHYAIISIQL